MNLNFKTENLFDAKPFGEKYNDMTLKERLLFKLFFEREGNMIARAEVLKSVWTKNPPASRTLEVHLHNLRKKIPPHYKIIGVKGFYFMKIHK